jgi:eukaryotic-like serine/threonine-protein kinase
MQRGTLVGDRFEIERLAAAGGMGKIYRACDVQTGRFVALKIGRCESPDDEMRFSREALVLADIDYPAIVRYVAHGFTTSGESYLAMEWLEGEDLAARLLQGRLTVAEALTVGQRVAAALAALHARGVVHRDIKPSNLFLPGGALAMVKLLDFGLAQRRGAAGSASRRGALMGTLGYMAPERVRGSSVDARADVFSLGCVLFECLTGQPAFAAAHMAAVLGKILFEDPVPVGELCPGVPLALEDLIARMLAKDPSVRPQDGAAVAAALESRSHASASPQLGARASSPSLTVDELGLVSVIAAGEAPSIDKLDQLDQLDGEGPLSPKARLAPQLAAAVAPFAAQLEDLEGGLLIATLKGTANAADQAARAARCALAMREALGDLPLAIATGRGHLGGRLPIGAAIERAISLLRGHARERPAGERAARRAIAVDEVTAGLLDARFEVTARGDLLELAGERDASTPSVRLLLGRPTPCVGREREIEVLFALLEECVAEPRARAALVTGGSGMGKSRLRHEFLRGARDRAGGDAEIWVAQADATRSGTPLGLVAQIVRRAVGLRDGDPIEPAWDRLAAYVSRRAQPADAARMTDLLGEILGGEARREDAPDPNATLNGALPRSDLLRRAFVDFIAAEVKARTVVIVIEDMHWADRPSVTFLDAALRLLREKPLFVLALARTEVHDIFPRLWVDRGVQEIRLEALSRRAGERLVRAVLGEAAARPTVDRLLAQAGGNALYLEELIRAVASGRGEVPPESVILMAQSRLTALEPEARRALRAASIFGEVFWSGGVRALLGDTYPAIDLEPCLASLVEREILRQRTTTAFAGEIEYAFRHALLREATLGTLTAEDRALGHRLAAAWLEVLGERDAAVLAEHLERGGEPERAISLYMRAAAAALAGNALDAAEARAERAVMCGASGEVLGKTRAIQAEVHALRGDAVEAERCGIEAMELLPVASEAHVGAIVAVGHAAFLRGDRARLATLIDEVLGTSGGGGGGETSDVGASLASHQLVVVGALDVIALRIGLVDQANRLFAVLLGAPAPQRREPAVAGSIEASVALRASLAGEPSRAIEALAASAASFEQAGQRRRAVLQRLHVGVVRAASGAALDDVAELREALALAEREGIALAVPWIRTEVGLALARRGEPSEGRAIAEGAVTSFVHWKNTWFEGYARSHLARILLHEGHARDAEREARRAVEITERLPRLRAVALSVLAWARLSAGQPRDARPAAESALALLDRGGGVEDSEALVRNVLPEVLAALGDLVGARSFAAAARERLLERSASIDDPAHRARFLEEVPEHAQTLALYRRLHEKR